MIREDLKAMAQILGIVTAGVSLIIAIGLSIGWMVAGYEARALSELTGQDISQEQVFWGGDHIQYQIEEQK